MLTLLAADVPGLGRVDLSMLSETQVMELFFVPDDYEDSREHLKGDASDACTWTGMECNTYHQVERIGWLDYIVDIAGEINFLMFPRHLRALLLINQEIRGEVNLLTLPTTIEDIQVEYCRIKGTLDFGSLPLNLKSLVFICNGLTGLVNVLNLPATLKHVQINECRVQPKSLYIGKLPSKDLRIDLYDCGITVMILEDDGDRPQITE